MEQPSQSSNGSLSSSSECAKKQRSLEHLLPVVHSCVLYLIGCSQHSNTPWDSGHASPSLQLPLRKCGHGTGWYDTTPGFLLRDLSPG